MTTYSFLKSFIKTSGERSYKHFCHRQLKLCFKHYRQTNWRSNLLWKWFRFLSISTSKDSSWHPPTFWDWWLLFVRPLSPLIRPGSSIEALCWGFGSCWPWHIMTRSQSSNLFWAHLRSWPLCWSMTLSLRWTFGRSRNLRLSKGSTRSRFSAFKMR